MFRLGPSDVTTAAASVALLALAGCGLMPIGGVAVDAEAARAQAAEAAMGCEQAQSFTFAGETTLAALGLDEFGGPAEANRMGMVWVTQDAVSFPGPGPMGEQAAAERMVCVQWPDGSGMAGSVPPGWQPPSALDRAAGSGQSEPPLVLFGLVLAALVVGGVSFLAFRERPG